MLLIERKTLPPARFGWATISSILVSFARNSYNSSTQAFPLWSSCKQYADSAKKEAKGIFHWIKNPVCPWILQNTLWILSVLQDLHCDCASYKHSQRTHVPAAVLQTAPPRGGFGLHEWGATSCKLMIQAVWANKIQTPPYPWSAMLLWKKYFFCSSSARKTKSTTLPVRYREWSQEQSVQNIWILANSDADIWMLEVPFFWILLVYLKPMKHEMVLTVCYVLV